MLGILIGSWLSPVHSQDIVVSFGSDAADKPAKKELMPSVDQDDSEMARLLEREFTNRRVRVSNPPSASRLPPSSMDNLALSQPSFFLLVAWQLGTESQLKHEAAWCSTFSCLETSQTRDSAEFQVSLSQNQICLQMSVFRPAC
ncbi:hypothetical protein CSKR_102894 [Clonorchis sinensis]|uniref:Uncharacterized protein n=1 Tax=Clonorchis sinensis TaxID=79923 RepID=A0A3R7H4D7_CLOSI|nr:hypothetical protein CSKR_102894 [Clonorchis sinensis]